VVLCDGSTLSKGASRYRWGRTRTALAAKRATAANSAHGPPAARVPAHTRATSSSACGLWLWRGGPPAAAPAHPGGGGGGGRHWQRPAAAQAAVRHRRQAAAEPGREGHAHLQLVSRASRPKYETFGQPAAPPAGARSITACCRLFSPRAADPAPAGRRVPARRVANPQNATPTRAAGAPPPALRSVHSPARRRAALSQTPPRPVNRRCAGRRPPTAAMADAFMRSLRGDSTPKARQRLDSAGGRPQHLQRGVHVGPRPAGHQAQLTWAAWSKARCTTSGGSSQRRRLRHRLAGGSS
jgi:hypothetical protein